MGKYDVDKMNQFEKDYNYDLLQKANEMEQKQKEQGKKCSELKKSDGVMLTIVRNGFRDILNAINNINKNNNNNNDDELNLNLRGEKNENLHSSQRMINTLTASLNKNGNDKNSSSSNTANNHPNYIKKETYSNESRTRKTNIYKRKKLL